MFQTPEDMPLPRTERRWVILAPDGKYVTVGRTTDPSDIEIQYAEGSMRARGTYGWLAVMEGNPNSGPPPRLMEVRPLADPAASFAEAAAACVAAIVAQRQPADGREGREG